MSKIDIQLNASCQHFVLKTYVHLNKEDLIGEDDFFNTIFAGAGMAAMAILVVGSFIVSAYYFAFQGVGKSIFGACKGAYESVKSDSSYSPIQF